MPSRTPRPPTATDDCDVTYPRKRWTLPEADPDAAAELAGLLKTAPVVGQLLLNRGFTAADPDAARRFARPAMTDLLEPAGIPGLPAAAERLALALKNGETVAIYGDYDVDGITATSILWHALTLLGGDPGRDAGRVLTYVPHRVDEGYGLNAAAVDKLADDGATVIVSVDCGITAVEPAAIARARGVDLIITDHHEWKTGDDGVPLLPDAFALVHPRLPAETEYANPHLTGAGVAFKLAWEVGKRVTGRDKVSADMRGFLVDALALAALGTIADVAPLTGENRTIARFGLGGLTKTKLRGLRALIDSAGLGGKELDSYHVGFLLGPRLNACGRMGHAARAVHMLTAATPGEAKETADFLEAQNRDRQNTERKIVDQAVETVLDRGWDRTDCSAVVVDGQGWHPGVVGIVASRLVDKFARPAVVLASDDGTSGGSGRSVGGFHLAHALAACDDLLTSHGGHAMAAGLKLDTANVDAFRDRFTALAREQLAPEDLVPTLRADAVVTLGQIDRPLVEELARLGPFGAGNPKPVLVVRGLTVLSARSCGKTGDHLQLQLDDNRGGRLKAIAFGCGKLALTLRGGDVVDVAAEPGLNEWNGRVSVELVVRDLAPVD